MERKRIFSSFLAILVIFALNQGCAVDNGGGSSGGGGSNEPIIINPNDPELPQPSFNSPQSGQHFTEPADVLIDVNPNYDDEIDRIDIRLNNSLVISLTNGFTHTLEDLTEGTYTIKVTTVLPDGTSNSRQITIYVDPKPDVDTDGDGVDDNTDNCQTVSNPGQADLDNDGIGDVCDDDIDGDGTNNDTDNCELIQNSDQADLDADGIGDACDDDVDGDGTNNGADCEPLNKFAYQEVTFYADADNDDLPDNDTASIACAGANPTVPNGWTDIAPPPVDPCLNDPNNNCNNDADGDGYDASTDCDDTNPNNWNSCAACTDNDSDSWFVNCDAYSTINGPDCDDTDKDNWTSCAACTDNDSDSYYVNCDAYTTRNGPDCDDTDSGNWDSCGTCVDNDGDSWFVGCNDYTGKNGPDCNDNNQNVWDKCATCTDSDFDSYYVDCNAYVTISGPDCDDNDSDNWDKCATCIDNDADTYYKDCNAYGDHYGPDCDDNDKNNWTKCATCLDSDNDNFYVNCDAYITISGPDCNDADKDNWNMCATCRDVDQDNYYAFCNAYTTHSGPDCDDNDKNNWTKCATCVDNDSDTYFIGCNTYTTIKGPDCSDSNPIKWNMGSIYEDSDHDDMPDNSTEITACIGTADSVPTGYTMVAPPPIDPCPGDSLNTCTNDVDGDGVTVLQGDCDDSDPDNWDSCLTCKDQDNDSWYLGCDAYTKNNGPDCDDSDPNNWTSCLTCKDQDSDNWYLGCDVYSTINGPDCDDTDDSKWNTCGSCTDNDGDTWYVNCNDYTGINGPDCNDQDTNHWSDCSTCIDADGDDYGQGCDLGADCDDNVNTGSACHNVCMTYYQDSDADSYGKSNVSALRCTAPAGYVLNGTDCNDTNNDIYPGAPEVCDSVDNQCPGDAGYGTVDENCTSCIDNDGDNRGDGCANGADCDDSNKNTWDTCATCQDNDGDTFYETCNQYLTVKGPDCNDTDPDNWESCVTCQDFDNDTWYANCDDYTTRNGPDCDDNDNTIQDNCDIDGDGILDPIDGDTHIPGDILWITWEFDVWDATTVTYLFNACRDPLDPGNNDPGFTYLTISGVQDATTTVSFRCDPNPKAFNGGGYTRSTIHTAKQLIECFFCVGNDCYDAPSNWDPSGINTDQRPYCSNLMGITETYRYSASGKVNDWRTLPSGFALNEPETGAHYIHITNPTLYNGDTICQKFNDDFSQCLDYWEEP